MSRGRQRKAWIQIRQAVAGFENECFFANEYRLLLQRPDIEKIFVTLRAFKRPILVVKTRTIVTRPLVGADQKPLGSLRLGKYSIVIKRELMTGWHMAIVCTASGRKDGKLLHPYGHGSAGVGGICFGAPDAHYGRNIYIKELLKQGELFTLIAVVLDSLAYINPSDTGTCAERYLKASNTKERETQ